MLPLRPNLPARQTHDYRRHGLTSLYAALEVASGRVLGECYERHTGADFLRFLKVLNRRYRRRELHVILDNSSTHSTPEVRTWLECHPNVCFHFTPTGASWLNMLEAWFGILTRKSVRRARSSPSKTPSGTSATTSSTGTSTPHRSCGPRRPRRSSAKLFGEVVNMTSATEH